MPKNDVPTNEAGADDELFWDLAAELIADDRASEGELMRSRCLRVNGEFLAMAEYRTGDLVVKLPRGRVDDLVGSGVGLAFAPANKVFREWVQVPGRDEALWRSLIDEGLAFVS